MADGLSTANANLALAAIVGTNAAFVQLHIGDPGSAGTSNVSDNTTREAQAWNDPSDAEVTAADTPTWSDWDATSPETDTDISMWSEDSSGAFGFSTTFSSSVTMTTGNTLEITSQSVSLATAS